MTSYIIKEAKANGTKITISVKAKEGEKTNISGNINIPAPDWYIKQIYPRPINSELMASMVAKKMIGKEIPLSGMFGQESRKELKKRLKKMGIWQERNNKFEIKFSENTSKTFKYTEMWTLMESVEGIKRIEEFELKQGKVVFFRENEDTELITILKKIEELPFVGLIENVKKLEVKS